MAVRNARVRHTARIQRQIVAIVCDNDATFATGVFDVKFVICFKQFRVSRRRDVMAVLSQSCS